MISDISERYSDVKVRRVSAVIEARPMSPVLTPRPPKAETKPVIYRGPKELIAEIDAVAAELGLSRTEAMTQFLRFALEVHRKEASKRLKR